MSKANEPTLSQQLAQLEDIVAWFEQDDMDIEAAIAKFEEGSVLAASIRTKLDTLENTITVLKETFEAK